MSDNDKLHVSTRTKGFRNVKKRLDILIFFHHSYPAASG